MSEQKTPTTSKTTEESGTWPRGSSYLTCASLLHQNDHKNEETVNVPTIVIKKLNTNVECKLVRNTTTK